MRNDLQGVTRCPSEIESYLLTIGGKTPYGEPMFRLVLASNVVWKVQGGKIWDASVPINERGGFVLDESANDDVTHRLSTARPLRDESDRIIEQQRYPHLEGWILQRWFPASTYDKSQWYAVENCMPDGTPKLGPFPQFGDYEIVGGPVEHVPTKTELRDFVSGYWRNLETRNVSVAQRALEANHAAQVAAAKEEARIRQTAVDYMRDKCSYINSCSLEAGRIRTAQAEKLGIREHVGA